MPNLGEQPELELGQPKERMKIRLGGTDDGMVAISLPDGLDSVALDPHVAVEFAVAIVQLATVIRSTMNEAMERDRKMTTEAKPTHEALSPSARHRWGACPASAREALKYETRASGPAAIDGTHSHTVLEYCLKNAVHPMTLVGQVFTDHEGEFIVNEDRAERVDVALQYILTTASKIESRYEIIAESRVDPFGMTGRSDLAGTVDVQIRSEGVLELIDYKDGMSPTDAREQLEQYAIGVLSELTVDPEPTFSFEKIKLTVIQPKLAMKGMEPISSIEMSFDDVLFKVLPKIIAEAAATDDPNAPYVPGEKQCRYCAHRGNCKAALDQAMSSAGIKFDNLSAPSGTMTDAELRKVIESIPLLRSMIEAVEAEALARFKSGKPVEGLKMVRNAGRRAWALPEEEIAAKLTKMKVPKGLIYKSVLISPAQTDKLAWENKRGDKVSLTERQRKVLESEMIAKSEGSLAVVPESDRRSAVETGDIRTMFQPQLPNWMS